MISRVTQGSFVRDLLRGLGRLEKRIADAQGDLSSGKHVREPSDDPSGVERASRLRVESRELAALRESFSFATSVLGLQDATLDQAEGLLSRAQEIAAQHASGLSTTDARQQVAIEVADIERALLTLANTSFDGRYVFAGLTSGPTPPFLQLDDPGFDPLDPYSGPSQSFALRAATDETMRLTTPGDLVFGPAIAAIDELRATLAAGGVPASSFEALDQATDVLTAERASIGARARRVEEGVVDVQSTLLRAAERIAAIEEAEVTEVVTELTRLQAALQATLESGRVLQSSILDHIRF
ncbi:MAG: hypothetical protein FJ144_03625 [Deltaproteobacteria bacterium]|nr:hypothetical protein [Deltaproteobacteria bacterium]